MQISVNPKILDTHCTESISRYQPKEVRRAELTSM